MRADLVALTADDLAGLTNRGTVKRALREVDAVSVSESDDGTVLAVADDATVTLPAGVPVEDASCTCAAVGACRHIVRAVLAYAAGASSPAAAEAWDPGALDYASLRPAVLRRGRALLAAGVTATVVRSAKPMALLHDVEATVRFLVPHDLAYARCDCASQPPCEHVIPAIEAFRALGESVESGVIEIPPRTAAGAASPSAAVPASATAAVPASPPAAVPAAPPASPPAASPPPAAVPASPAAAVPASPPTASPPAAVPASPPAASPSAASPSAASPRAAAVSPPALTDVEAALAFLAEAGLSGGGTAVVDALRRAEHHCRAGGLPWPADICAELADLAERHARADAAFDPLRVAQLAGEALLRGDALRAHSVPALFAGGPRATAETEVGGGRLVGLGTRVRQVGKLVDVDALVYDTGAHRVLAVGRTFGDSDKSFAELASTSLQRAIPIGGVGSGQLVATGGRRSPGGRLKLGRRPAALSAQRFEWSTHLQAPVLVEGAAEARGMRGAPPPLSPRTAGAGLVVIPLSAVDQSGFHVATQSVVALVRDALGGALVIASPYHHRAAGGAEQLLAAFADQPLFVAGEVRLQGTETVITPIALVVESPDGARRMIQPWIDRGDPAASVAFAAAASTVPPGEPAVAQHLHDLQSALGALLVTGATRADRSVRDTWTSLAEATGNHGSVLLSATVQRVSDALAARAHDTAWTPTETVTAALTLAAILELALAI